MSRIISALNVMVAHPEKIKDVVMRNGEHFFKYKDKYIWSLTTSTANLVAHYYPDAQQVSDISNLEGDDWESVNFVSYASKDFGTREADATFKALHQVLAEKASGIDVALDDILDDEMPF